MTTPAGDGCRADDRDNVPEHVLAFSLDEQRFALPLAAVDRVVRAVEVTPLPKTPGIVLGVINVQGRVIPVINLRRRCRLPERDVEPDDQFVLAHTARRMVALPVDAAEVIACPRETVTCAADVLAGLDDVRGVVRSDGGLVLIFDPDALLSTSDEDAIVDAIRPGSGPRPAAGDASGTP